MEPERRLIGRVRRGSRRAFVDLIERYQRLVEHVVFRMVKDPRDREELAQDVFVKVHRHIGTFRGEAKLSTWIARIAYTTCLNHLEKKRIALAEDVAPDAPPPEPASARNPALATERSDARAVVLAALDALSERDRAVLTLYHLDGMPIREISEVVRRPEGTVKSDLYRARARLKDRLLQHFDQEDLL